MTTRREIAAAFLAPLLDLLPKDVHLDAELSWIGDQAILAVYSTEGHLWQLPIGEMEVRTQSSEDAVATGNRFALVFRTNQSLLDDFKQELESTYGSYSRINISMSTA